MNNGSPIYSDVDMTRLHTVPPTTRVDKIAYIVGMDRRAVVGINNAAPGGRNS